MRKLYYITLLAVLLLTGSCGEWLEVDPRSQIKQSTLYSSEEGFRNSLNGIYTMMAAESMYGQGVTYHIPEYFARHWIVPANTQNTFYVHANFDYPNMEGTLEALWIFFYKAIAQANDLLVSLEGSDVTFNQTTRALLEGEALGLRAFLHFEMLRFFAPMPRNADMTAKAIPYVTTMSTDPQKSVSLSYGDVIKKIEEDLTAAEKLLETKDPITLYSNEVLNSSLTSGFPVPVNEDTNEQEEFDHWLLLRQGRFNYYACLGAQARFYQWIGQREKATAAARKVIEAVNDDGTSKFTLATESSYTGVKANMTMFCEQLFGLEISHSSQTNIESMFNIVGSNYSQDQVLMDECYEKTINPDDIRYKSGRYWEQKVEAGITTNYFRKFTGNGTVRANRRMPVLRLAEMYLIVIENLPVQEALPYFRKFRIARAMGVNTENEFAVSGETDKMKRVEKEYRKDFYGEGQMFFFYKRLDYKGYTWPVNYTFPEHAYQTPKPKGQAAFE